ncbi:unnamed protein product [Phytomonas sp. EM1]|nr:unnamed protein product [Phytomonas sp. EM1]|eukprot:CCW60895.1 unnamed protein product [Phytomonas sp. isolate EM1]
MVQWRLCDASSKAILAEMMDRDSSYSSIPTTPIEFFSTTLPSPPSPRSSVNHNNDGACGLCSNSSRVFEHEGNPSERPVCSADARKSSSLHCGLQQPTEDIPTFISNVVETPHAEPLQNEGASCPSSRGGEALLNKGGEYSGNCNQASPSPEWDLPSALPEAPAAGTTKANGVTSSREFPLSWQHAYGFHDELRRLKDQVLNLEHENVENKQHQEEMAALLVKSTAYMEKLKHSLQEESRLRENAERIIQESKLRQRDDRNIQGPSSNVGEELDHCLSSRDMTSSFGKFSAISSNPMRRKKSPRSVQNTSSALLSSASMDYPKRKLTEVMEGKLAKMEKENARLLHSRETLSKKLRSALLAREAAERDQQRTQQRLIELERQLAQAVSENQQLAESIRRALGEKADRVAELEQQLEVALRTRRAAEELRVLFELSLSFVLGWLNRDSSPQYDGVWGRAEAEQTETYEVPSESIDDGGEGEAPELVCKANVALQITEGDILSSLEHPIVLTDICVKPSGIPFGKPSRVKEMKIDSKEMVNVNPLPQGRGNQMPALSNATLLSLPQCQQSVNRALAAVRLAARRRQSTNQTAFQFFSDSCLGLIGKTQFEVSNALGDFSKRLLIAQQRLQQAVVHFTQLEARDAGIEAQLRSELKRMQADMIRINSRLRLLQAEKEGVEKQLAQLQRDCRLADKLNEVRSFVADLRRTVGHALRETVSDLQDVVAVDANSLRGPFLRQIQAVALRGEAHLELIDRFLTCKHSDPSSGGVPHEDGDDEDFASVRSSCVSKVKQRAPPASPNPTSCMAIGSLGAHEEIERTDEAMSLAQNNTEHNLKRDGDHAVMPSGAEGSTFHEGARPDSLQSTSMMTPRQMKIYYHMKHLIQASPSPFPTLAGRSPVVHPAPHPYMATPSSVSATHHSRESGSRDNATPARLAAAASPERDGLVQGARALTRQLTNMCKLIENSSEQSADHARNIQSSIASYEKNIKNAIETVATVILELLREGFATHTKGENTTVALSVPSSLMPGGTSLPLSPPATSLVQSAVQGFCCRCGGYSVSNSQTATQTKVLIPDQKPSFACSSTTIPAAVESFEGRQDSWQHKQSHNPQSCCAQHLDDSCSTSPLMFHPSSARLERACESMEVSSTSCSASCARAENKETRSVEIRGGGIMTSPMRDPTSSTMCCELSWGKGTRRVRTQHRDLMGSLTNDSSSPIVNPEKADDKSDESFSFDE